ncbi:DUF2779 domain-containing protein [Geothermobacter hydrogeniphilus]|uniref:DUF2779 domain-containing protein n=1 Tax=Geothermobacter hydrogeniphilus TaxID=1969733 RepID=A0A1X0Y8K3_9BACT|nr:DUF2779 domain-containing protein [Geothermobacter hydrogeniphilus]ORJ61354.1 hypothetical protein B5V00_06895 [Geothermobacter hydrogeniphilus]
MRQGLSKGLYIRGKQCPKSLWLHKFKPELKDEVSERQKAAFGAGTEVGELACNLFPGGVMVPFKGLSIAEQVTRTRQAIANGEDTIYEASFEHDGIFVKVDILRQSGEAWDIYEVKGSTEVKPVHMDDVALQAYVLRNAGLDVGKVNLVHLNNKYCRRGNIDPHELFSIADLTKGALEKQEEVAYEVRRLRDMLTGDMPEVGIGRQCSSPYDCDFQGYCWQDVPEDSVFELNGRGIDPFAYYHRGMRRLEDLPLADLNRRQRLQVELHLSKGERINAAEIANFLEDLWYPLVHLDFETFMAPIPLFDNSRPYQQVPFQYSLHIQQAQNSSIEHREYLARPGVDPRPGLIEGLLREIPQDACVLTYNMAFEKGRLKELAKDFPDHAEGLNGILSRVRDLIVPFRKRHAYRWQQRGSSSIKKVLPAFVPGLSYKGMPIADGGMAMAAYHLMCAERDPGKLAEIRENLLAYCKLDTEAMVQLLEQLYELSQV